MKNYIKNIILIITFFALTACSGTGYNSYSNMLSNMEVSEKSKVFILRIPEAEGGLNKAHLQLNNIEIAQLGIGEMIYGYGQIGNNIITLEMKPILAYLDPIQLAFTLSEGEDKYFVVGLDKGRFNVVEWTRDYWISYINK